MLLVSTSLWKLNAWKAQTTDYIKKYILGWYWLFLNSPQPFLTAGPLRLWRGDRDPQLTVGFQRGQVHLSGRWRWLSRSPQQPGQHELRGPIGLQLQLLHDEQPLHLQLQGPEVGHPPGWGQWVRRGGVAQQDWNGSEGGRVWHHRQAYRFEKLELPNVRLKPATCTCFGNGVCLLPHLPQQWSQQVCSFIAFIATH